jgi:hypothetical protein
VSAYADIGQLHGNIAQIQPRDYSKELSDLKRDLDILRKEFVNLDKRMALGTTEERLQIIHRPEIRYPDQVPSPPPETPPSSEPSPPSGFIVEESFEIADN